MPAPHTLDKLATLAHYQGEAALALAHTSLWAAPELHGDRTYYLHGLNPDAPGGTTVRPQLDGTEASVITWHDTGPAGPSVTLTLNNGPFGLHLRASPDEARTLAYALLLAASHADAAGQPS